MNTHLRKISKIGATRCQIFRLKCTKFHFRRGIAPHPLAETWSEVWGGQGRRVSAENFFLPSPPKCEIWGAAGDSLYL